MEQSAWFVVKPNEEDLMHHGVKDQKWGQRRYQNRDGSLTPEGRRHYGYDSEARPGRDYREAKPGDRDTVNYPRDNNKNKNKGNDSNSNNNKKPPSKEEIKTSEYKLKSKKMEAQSKVTDAASKFLNKSAEKAEKKAMSKMNLNNLSDDELRERINRYNLEKQYKQIAAGDVAKGRKSLSSLLDTTGSILAVGVSAATLASIIWEMKQKKDG